MAGKQRQGDFPPHEKIPWGKAEVVRGAGQAARKKGSKKGDAKKGSKKGDATHLLWPGGSSRIRTSDTLIKSQVL